MLMNGFTLEQSFTNYWFISCALGGAIFIAFGARAGGLALWSALAGAFIGTMLVSSNLDQLPYGATLGASVGAFIGGLAGLAWKPRSDSASISRGLGTVSILVGLFVTWEAWTRACGAYRDHTCLPHVTGWEIALFLLDAAWVAALCFIQAAQSNAARRSIAPTGPDPMTASPGAPGQLRRRRLHDSEGVNRWVLAAVLAAASAWLIWFGTLIVEQSQTAPAGKLFLASWLESQLWIDPGLVGIGLLGLAAAIVVLVLRRPSSSQVTQLDPGTRDVMSP